MHTFFVILDYLSVFVMIACVATVATHESGKMQKLALMTCVMLLFCCTGFLIKGEATTAEVMITGQKLVYATVTHSMLLMLLFILEYCRFTIPKALEWTFHGINFLITLIVLTLDHHELFYVRYWTEEVNGTVELMKEYGPAHTLAVAVFGCYMAAALLAAVVFSVRNIRERRRYVWRLLIAVSLPCAAYIIPKLIGTVNELQPIAFSLFVILLLRLVYKSKLYDVNDIATQYALKSVHDALIIFDDSYGFKGCNEVALNLFPFLKQTTIDKDLRSESEFLCGCVDGKETEYVEGDRIWGVSVRPVKSGEAVIGRVVWFEDVTIERNYTKLLKEQKLALENRVETLYGISYTDDMTGLANRRCYEQALSVIREANDLTDLIVGELDLNGLKYVNDNVGHKAGDELIVGAADVLRKVFGGCGRIFRTGGDEYFVIIEDASVDLEAKKAELEKEVGAWKGELNGSLSISHGFIRAGDYPGKTIDELLLLSDKEMYKNKAAYYTQNGIDRRRADR